MMRGSGRVTVSLVFLCAPAMFAQKPAEPTPWRPAVYRSHFQPNPGANLESGLRDGWESFPISQEAGYDPSINPETSHGESALVRDLAPSQDGPFQLGFIRRFHRIAGARASLQARVRIPYALGATTVTLSIFRGEIEEHHALTLTGSRWQEIIFPIVASPSPITAIALAANFPHAIRGRPERILMADVRLKILAIRHLPLSSPQSFWDDTRELAYLKHALHPGDNLEVHLATQAAESTQNLRWTLTAPGGVLAAQGTGSQVRYHLASTDTIGIWAIHFFSPDAETTALLLVRPSQPLALLSDRLPPIPAGILASIRERRAVLEKTTHPETGMNIDSMDPHWLLAGLPSYFAIILQPSELAMMNALEFRATGDHAARDRSIALLRAIAGWRMWVHPWFPAHGYHSYYPVGIMTKYIVMTEQFLGRDLSEEDRDRLDRSLMDLSVKPIYEEYVLEDRLQFNTSNWIGNTVGGAFLAALQSNDPDAAGYALGLYVKERDHVQASYTPDGSYGEGVTYQRFDLEMTTLVAEAAKRHLGTSIDEFFPQPERYMKYASYGKEGLLDFGDSHVDLTPSNVFAYLAAQNKAFSLNDFYFRHREEGTAQILSRVLWESSISTSLAEPPPEPASALFPQRGVVVLRDNHNPDSTVVAMRAGMNYNHNHADEGSVFFAHAGKLWLGEAGYADYYKDPSYSTFHIQAIGHNTLLVNGDAQSQIIPGNAVFGRSPSFTHSLLGPSASLVQADLTAAYSGEVLSYSRSLFFQAGGPLVVIDAIKTRSPQRFTQVWHPEQKVTRFSALSNQFDLSDGHTRLAVQTYAIGSIATSQRLSPMPLVDYERSEHGVIDRPVQFEISDIAARTSETIVTFIQPHDDPHQQEGQFVPATWEAVTTSSTLRWNQSGVQLGSTTAADGKTPYQSIQAWWPNGAYLLCGTQYDDKHFNASVSASHPIDLQLRRAGGRDVQLEFEATTQTDLTLNHFVTTGETACAPALHCTQTSDILTLSIPKGSSVLHLRYSSSERP